ncbi:protease modulator HflK [Klebsiella aerogenes]
MVPNLNGENRRLRSRLLWCRAISTVLLISAGAGYVALPPSAAMSSWLPLTRLLIAALLLVFALSENALRQLPPAAKKPGKRRWTIALPPRAAKWTAHLTQLALTALCAGLSIDVVSMNFTASGSMAVISSGLIPVAIVLTLLCFALLVCERMLSFRSVRHWPYQNACVGLLRALLSLGVLSVITLAVSNFALTPAGWLVELASAIVVLIAAEFLLRTLAAALVAPSADKAPPFLSQSLLAELYRWPPRPLLLMRKKIQRHFGVDIGKIQAFTLMGQIFFPVLFGAAFIGWLISGIHEVSLQQRGVYERFGRPVEVLAPGLHVGLPWPFGHVVAVDYGAIHELTLSEAQSAQAQPTPAANAAPVDLVEGPAPQSSWRLWDKSHVTDQAQIIANAMGDKQSFQVVNMDIRLIWRVGMHDTDALNSLYQTDSLPITIQRIARQVLTQYFAHQQLDMLLNEQRSTMAHELNQQIQQRLSQLHIGVELLSTRIESIHPPAGAANAYHAVQAAQIKANAQIARERGYAAVVGNQSQQKATTAIAAASATANELQARANNALTHYSAEHDAWAINPEAFINERRYQIMSQALSHTPLLIIDSNVAGQHPPMLDLRQFFPSAQ